MANPILKSTEQAGVYEIPGAGKITLKEWREDSFYDCVQVGNASSNTQVSAGAKLYLFRDITSKNLPHTNLKVPRRIPAGSKLILTRIGLAVDQIVGLTVQKLADIMFIMYGASFTFRLNTRLVAQGPAIHFPSGLGVQGSTTENNVSVATSGVPSVAAAPTMMVAQPVTSNDDLDAELSFDDDAWLSGNASATAGTLYPMTLSNKPVVRCVLHGFISKPMGQ